MSPTALYDYHIHDSYSRDAPTSHLDRLVTVAEDRGLEEICITTHLIVAGKDTALGVQPEELPRYFRQIEEQQADTPGATSRRARSRLLPGPGESHPGGA